VEAREDGVQNSFKFRQLTSHSGVERSIWNESGDKTAFWR
jgi:hypothetical protein